MKRKAVFQAVMAGAVFISASVQAVFIEAPHQAASTRAISAEALLLQSTDSGAERFKPVGKLSAHSECTATLITNQKKPDREQPALILTAGHCVNDYLSTNQTVVDQPADEAWKYTPDYFIDVQQSPTIAPVAVSRVLYATMKEVDLAVLQLDATYGQLAEQGIYPLQLQKKVRIQKQNIEVAHIPVNGIEPEQAFLRHSDCHVIAQVPVLYEYTFPWMWKSPVAVDCAGIVGGSSGSPVFEQNGEDIVGIINTTTTQGLTGCGLGRPCEVENNKGVPRENASYFIPVEKIVNALDSHGRLDLTKLDQDSGDTLLQNWIWTTQSTVNDEPAVWNVSVDSSVTAIRYKTGTLSELDCSRKQGYSASVATSEQPLMSLPVPQEEGLYLLCVIAQKADGSWQPPEFASVMLREIDDTPPAMVPELNISIVENLLVIEPVFNQYEIVDILTKEGPVAETDCEDRSDYYAYRRIPIVLQKEDGPWRICAFGRDQASNAGPIVVRDVE